MTYLSIDLGDARIGIAISFSGVVAKGVETYNRIELEKDLDYLAKVIRENAVDIVVMGLPLNMDGTEGDRVEKTKEFTKLLQERISAKIEFQDERLTTFTGERMLVDAGVRRDKRKKVIDKIAATIILQSYLDKLNV